MEKFFFSPTREESLELLTRLFSPDDDEEEEEEQGAGPTGRLRAAGGSRPGGAGSGGGGGWSGRGGSKEGREREAERIASALLDAFPRQPLDFFGGLKSRMADQAVRAWVKGGLLLLHFPSFVDAPLSLSPCPPLTHSLSTPLPSTPGRPLEALHEPLLGDSLMHSNDPLAYKTWPRPRVEVDVSLEAALRAGRELASEQQHVLDENLVKVYFKYLDGPGASTSTYMRALAHAHALNPCEN
jgi:hypothetical protein